MTAVAYALVCLTAGAGLDVGAGDEKALLGWLATMCTLVLCVSLITRFVRMRRQTPVDRERQGTMLTAEPRVDGGAQAEHAERRSWPPCAGLPDQEGGIEVVREERRV